MTRTAGTHEGPVLPALAQNAGSQFLGRASAGLVQVLGLILAARHFGPSEYGVFGVIVTLTVVATVIADWGLILIATREIARGSPAETVLRNALGLRLALGAAGIATVIALSFVSSDDTRVHVGAGVAALSFVPHAWFGIAQIRAQVDMRLERVAAALFAGAVAGLCWIVAVVVSDAGVALLAGSVAMTALASAIVAAALTPGGLPLRPSFDGATWSSLFRAATPIGVALAFVTIYFYVDVLLLSRLSTSEQVGLYHAAYRFVQFGIFVPGILINSVYALASELAARDRAAFGRLTHQLLALTALIAPLPVLVAVAPRDVMVLLYGAAFSEAATVLALLGGALVLMIFSGVVGPLLIALGRERLTMKIGAVAAVANVTMNLVLIPKMGAEGAAVATFLTECVVLAPASYVLLRTSDIRIAPSGTLKIALAIVGGAAVVLLVPGPILARLSAAFVAYVALLVATRQLGRHQLALTRTPRIDSAPSDAPREAVR